MTQVENIKNQLAKVERATPLQFEKSITDWFAVNGKRITTFSGSEENSRKIMAGLFYAASLNPDLCNATLQSLGNCMMQSAQLNLYPGALQEAHYLVFRNSKRINGDWVKVPEATLCPGYQGLIKLAYNSGFIKNIQCEVVYERDFFDYEFGTASFLKHRPFEGDDSERGRRVFVWCAIETKAGRIFRVKNAAWIERCRMRSPSGDKKQGPWLSSEDNYDEMACKCVLKLTLKRVPKSPELQRAIDLDNEVEQPEQARKPILEFPLAQNGAPTGAQPAPKVEVTDPEPQPTQELEAPPEPDTIDVPPQPKEKAFSVMTADELYERATAANKAGDRATLNAIQQEMLKRT